MKNTKLIKSLWIYPLMAIIGVVFLLLISCEGTEEKSPFPDIPEGNVLVVFDLPGVYVPLSGFDNDRQITRGVTVTDNHPNYLVDLNSLPVGTPVWVLVGQWSVGEGRYVEQVPKAYKVMASGAAYRQLYPCEVNQNLQGGETHYSMNMDGQGTHMLLKKGEKYLFRMLSMAVDKELVLKDNRYTVDVDNGDYLYSNDDRYPTGDPAIYPVRTKAVEYEVPASAATEIIEMKLNPMIQQTAKMQLVICPGQGVHDLEILSEGCELSGLETGPREWGPNLADTLKLQFGPKLGYIKQNTFTSIEHTSPGDINPHSDLMWETAVLPTDARSNSMSILLNLRVNGNPVQYMALLSDQMWQHARSYNLWCQVSIKDGITVFNFTTTGWSTEVPME